MNRHLQFVELYSIILLRLKRLDMWRAVNLCYLADWRHVLTTGCPISNADWHFGSWGLEVRTLFSSWHFVHEEVDVLPSWQAAIDHVFKHCRADGPGSLLQLVYSTYPIMHSDKNSDLDLVQMSLFYKELLKLDPDYRWPDPFVSEK